MMKMLDTAIRAMDAKGNYDTNRLPRKRQALFDAVVTLVQRQG